MRVYDRTSESSSQADVLVFMEKYRDTWFNTEQIRQELKLKTREKVSKFLRKLMKFDFVERNESVELMSYYIKLKNQRKRSHMNEEKSNLKSNKPVNITAIAMVFLSLSIIFVIVAYGYGERNQAISDNKWYTNYTNINNIANSLGYSLVKNEKDLNPVTNISVIISNLTNATTKNITVYNLTNTTSKNITVYNLTNTTPIKNITGGNTT